MSRHATAEADDDKRRARRVMAMDEADDAGGGLTAAELAALPDPYAHLRDSSPERAKRNAAAADRTKQPQQLSRRAAPRPQRVSFDEDSDDEADGEDDDEDYEDDEDDEENALRLDDEDEDDDDNDDEENENDDEDASGRGVGDGDAPALISGKRRQGSDAAERARGRAKAWHAGLGLTAAQITAFEELESATFAERQALRDAVGIKTYRLAMEALKSPGDNADQSQGEQRPPQKKQPKAAAHGSGKHARPTPKDKNAPLEMPSHKRPARVRTVVESNIPKARDPRFDELSGKFNATLFEKAYGFLDEKREREMREVAKALKKAKNPQDQQRLAQLLQSLHDRENAQKQEKVRRERQQERFKATVDANGKPLFFLKRSDDRKLEALQRFKELEAKGRVNKALEKRRKRNAEKERKLLPSRGAGQS